MNFHEKSAWACLVALLLVFVPYFLIVFSNPMALVAAVASLVALLAAFHIANVVATSSIRQSGEVPERDELDRLIELKASKRSGMVLGVAVLLWSLVAMVGAPAIGVQAVAEAGAEQPDQALFSVPVLHALTAVHVLFAGFVASNAVYYGSIVAAYRRIAHG